MKNKSDIIFLILLVLLVTPAIFGLIHSGFPLTDDGNWMVIRFSSFYEELRNGQFPVRFLTRLNNGYGYPVADFLYPLFMYIGAPIKAIGFSFVDSIKIIMAGSFIFSGIFTFLWLRKLFNNLPSLVGAIVYVYFPYHLWDVYKRGSIGEALAFTIIPFILWQVERKSLLWSSIGISFLILSHNTLAILFLFLVIVYMFLDLLIAKKRNKLLIDYIIILGSGIGISAFFWIPAIFDLRYTVFSDTKISNWSEYFSNLNLIGWSTIFITLLTFALVIFRKIDIKKHRLSVLMFLIGVISVFLASSFSYLLWNFLPVSFIQFPFRLLSLSVVCFSFLACFVVSVFSDWKKIFCAILIIFFSIISAEKFIFPVNYQNFPDTFYSTNQDTTTVRNEYMPKWVRQIPETRYEKKIEIVKGKGEIANLKDKGTKISFSIDSKELTTVQINTVYFPGWNVKLNGEGAEILKDNIEGLIQFKVNRGFYSVVAEFRETNIRLISDAISLASFLAIGLFAIKAKMQT